MLSSSLNKRIKGTNLILLCSPAEDQLQVDVIVTDANDNVPEFLTFENPVQVSISNSLQPGDIIAKMEVKYQT